MQYNPRGLFPLASLLLWNLAVPLFGQPPNIAAVVNGYTFTYLLSPGADASIFGSALSAGTCTALTAPVNPANGLCGTTASVGGSPAAVLYVSPSQVNVQIPTQLATP